MNVEKMKAAQEASFLGQEESDRLLDDIARRALPASWRLVARSGDGLKFVNAAGLSVIVTVGRELDGRRWQHVSCARRARLPSYDELKVVKNLFVGPEVAAVQVFPKASDHINIHEFCLHLFACLDGDALPDFTQGTGSL